jgi:hypothetical protein
MDDKLYRQRQAEQNKLRKARKLAEKKLAPEAEKIAALRDRKAAGETLTFAERNILNIFYKKLETAVKRSLK